MMQHANAKAEVRERPKKPPGYRKFAKLLKQVVKAPPMRKFRAEQNQDSKRSC